MIERNHGSTFTVKTNKNTIFDIMQQISNQGTIRVVAYSVMSYVNGRWRFYLDKRLRNLPEDCLLGKFYKCLHV